MTSTDYREAVINNQNHNNISTINTTNSMPSTDYREAVISSQNHNTNQTKIFPKKEQAIILSAHEELKLSDYVTAVGDLVQPKNILFASKISNNRLCIYLSSTHILEELISNHKSVKINNKEITIRRLITPSQRIVLSNVCPSIPHDLLESYIKSIGFTPVSQMSFLRAGISNEAYSHVLSFRRQIFVQPNDNIQLPSSTIIKFENTNYRIFFANNDLLCYICKCQGHIADQCPSQTTQNAGNITELETSPETLPNTTTNENQNSISDLLPTPNVGIKRPNDSLASTSSENLSQYKTQAEKEETPLFMKPKSSIQKKPKKIKTNPSEDNSKTVEMQLLPVKQIIEDASPPFKITYQQLLDFFENVTGTTDLIGLIQEYTDDIPHFLNLLYTIYPKLTSRTMKQRCTKIQKKIKTLIGINSSQESSLTDSDTDCSQKSTY